MSMLKFALVGNYKRFYNNLKKLKKEKITKFPAPVLFLDAALSCVLFGSGLSDYLNYKFYNKSLKKRKEYVTIGYMNKIYKRVAALEYAEFFSNKINFHKNFKKFARRDFYSPEESLENLKEFLNRNKVFIVKPVIGLGGTDIKIMSLEEVNNLKEFQEDLKRKKLFLEEKITQNEKWAEICPKSINTIRAMTKINKNNKPELFFAAARIGNGTSVTDNFHQGGMAVKIDFKSGKLSGNGMDKELNVFEKHPITGTKFDGFEIPFWQEIKNISLEAAMVNNKVKVVGWDIAITPNGPLIIESNRGPGFDLVQVLLEHGTKYMLKDL